MTQTITHMNGHYTFLVVKLLLMTLFDYSSAFGLSMFRCCMQYEKIVSLKIVHCFIQYTLRALNMLLFVKFTRTENMKEYNLIKIYLNI